MTWRRATRRPSIAMPSSARWSSRPRGGATEELDGYYLAFASSLGADRSARFLVWDAADFPAPPIAEVLIPQRVPNGLHGNWFAAG